MAKIPKTSTTMLKQIAGAAEHPRWAEFVAKYRPAMEAYARERFPALEADDLIQETLVGLMRALPDYVAQEDRRGAFHNYLTGVLRHKALDALRAEGRRAAAHRAAAEREEPPDEMPEDEWQRTIYRVALDQLLGDPRLGARAKQIFVRTALHGEKPQEVADALLTTRAVVDQTKYRLTGRLKQIIERLRSVDGH